MEKMDKCLLCTLITYEGDPNHEVRESSGQVAAWSLHGNNYFGYVCELHYDALCLSHMAHLMDPHLDVRSYPQTKK